jgi:hypothetical protein
MPIYQIKPTYFRVTWTIDSPTDYTTAGGITPLTSVQYVNTVAKTGTQASPTMSTGDVLVLNGYEIGPFAVGDTLSVVVDRFNDMVQYTGVMASENFTGYLTLQSVDPVDLPITLSNKTGTPVEDLGFTEGVFELSSPIYGGSFTTLTNTQTIILNGITVTFTTAGGLNVAGACSTINLATKYTGVTATPYTNKVQLNSIDGSPVYFGAPSTGTATANLGFATNTAYSTAITPANAVELEKGFLRWKGIASTIETNLTPYVYGYWSLTGSTTDGAELPTTVAWTVGIENLDNVYAITATGEPETVGTVLYGAAAIKRLVARALTHDWAENRNLYNDEVVVRGSLALRENPIVVQRVVASAIDTVANIATIESNIAVTMISKA